MTSLQINFIVILTVAFATTLIYGFNVPSFMGEAQISHSGPTNSLYGHEKFYDEEHDEHDRVKRGMYFPQFQQQQFRQQQWPELLVSSEPPNEYLKMWITSEHNRYRQLVPATNMRMLYWSEELAASAQRHANRCDFRHSRDRINVGENIWAAPYANYSDAVTRWFQEVNNPRCGCNHAYKHCCGHYIQVVWAQTNLIGCGFARCRDVWGIIGHGHHNVFVCHYNPQGNTVPAFNWASDVKPRCSECPTDAPACYEGLCYKPTLQEIAGSKNDQLSSPKQNDERINDSNASSSSNKNNNNQMSNKSFKEDSYKGNSNDVRRR